MIPLAPQLSPNLGKEYDLVEQLRATRAKISLWELLQTSSIYHESLKKALNTLPTPPPNQDNINSILECMHATLINPKIIFTQDDFPSKDVQAHCDSLMVVVLINENLIRRTLIDNGSGLNVCSMDILKAIKDDMSTVKPYNIPIHGFDNIAKNTLCIINLPVKVGSIILDTPIHMIPRPLNYNLPF